MFWENFFANLLSDLVAGGIIGSFIAWQLGKRLQVEEREQQQKDHLVDDKHRAIQYLQLLKTEITDLKESLPEELSNFNETGWGRMIQIESPFWETVDRSGELPRLIHPNMVKYIAQFYGHIGLARRGRDLLIGSWLVANPQTVPGMKLKQDAFMDMTDSHLREAIQLAPKLLEHVNDNISILKEQIEILQGNPKDSAL